MNRHIVDVREPDEFRNDHVEGSVNVPLTRLMNGAGLELLGKNDEIIVYCNSGNRSGLAKQILERNGFTNVANGINKETVTSKYK